MLVEVKGRTIPVNSFVLTGGLSRSLFFRGIIGAGIKMLNSNAKVFVSSRPEPLASQGATVGAMINAMLGSDPDLSSVTKVMCPHVQLDMPTATELKNIQAAISRALSRA